MRYELRVTAYDVMDEVWVSTVLHQTPDIPSGPTELVWALSSTTAGTGVTDPREWARDALVAALEVL